MISSLWDVLPLTEKSKFHSIPFFEDRIKKLSKIAQTLKEASLPHTNLYKFNWKFSHYRGRKTQNPLEEIWASRKIKGKSCNAIIEVWREITCSDKSWEEQAQHFFVCSRTSCRRQRRYILYKHDGLSYKYWISVCFPPYKVKLHWTCNQTNSHCVHGSRTEIEIRINVEEGNTPFWLSI